MNGPSERRDEDIGPYRRSLPDRTPCSRTDGVIPIDVWLTNRHRPAVRPTYLHAVHAVGLPQSEMHRVGVLGAVAIAGHDLPNGAPAVTAERYPHANRSSLLFFRETEPDPITDIA